MIVLVTTHAADDTGGLGTSSTRHVGIDEVRGLLSFPSFSTLFLFLVTVGY